MRSLELEEEHLLQTFENKGLRKLSSKVEVREKLYKSLSNVRILKYKRLEYARDAARGVTHA
jgi:hypothetical protein